MVAIVARIDGNTASQGAAILKASEAYRAGEYPKAIELYGIIIKEGYTAPYLFYNLGNAHFKAGDYPNAILNYERARRMDPGNEDIEVNINIANTKISDKIEPMPELFLIRWIKGWVFMLSVDVWAYLTVIMMVLSVTGITLYIASRFLLLRKTGFWTGILFFFLFLVSMGSAWSGYHFSTRSTEAIIFTPTIAVKSSPDENSTDLFVLHEGTKVTILDQINSWYEIRIANGSVGWLPGTSMEKI
jgi:tetratricopeptide (TPR) repeat protein